MILVTGRYYDGKTSRTVGAVFRVDKDGITRVTRSDNGDLLVSAGLDRIKISPRLAATPRYLDFPGGEKFETHDNQAIDSLLGRFGRGPSLVHFLESRMKYVLISLLVLLVFMWGGVKYGVPAASTILARHLPDRAVEYAGARTLRFLDKSVFKPSELTASTQERLKTHFQTVVDTHRKLGVDIRFRKGGDIGPNAFALPNGIIIFTDEMINIAAHDDELLAVLFHEVGHLVHNHGMRTVIQSSLLGFALMTLTGDVSGSAELFMGLPLFLTQMAYSRGFELEADQYALAGLEREGISPARFADLMERIEKKISARQKTRDQEIWSYLSTHPRMAERLKPFRKSNPGQLK